MGRNVICAALAAAFFLVPPANGQTAGQLEAKFTFDVFAGALPLGVQFVDQSDGGTPDSWLWDFGDGTTSTEQHPRHVYRETGTYDVTLQITQSAQSAEKFIAGAVTAMPAFEAVEELVLDVWIASWPMLTPDLDGDGLPDLIAGHDPYTSNPATLFTYLNTGGGVYGPVIEVALETRPERMAHGDLNGDSWDDIVYSPEIDDDRLRIKLSLGNGDLSDDTSVPVAGDGDQDFEFALLEADGDGQLDLLTWRSLHMAVRSGDGAGGFGAPGPDLPTVSAANWQDAHVMDVDTDGDLDVIHGWRYASNETVSWGANLNDGAGGYTLAPWSLPHVQSVSSVSLTVTGEFDGDGYVDVLAIYSDPLSLDGEYGHWMHGDGTQLTSQLAKDLVPSPVPYSFYTAVGDVDLDGVDDLLHSDLEIWLGGEDRVFGVQPFGEVLPSIESWGGRVLADVDGDGDLDFLGRAAQSPLFWNVHTVLNQAVPSGWTDLGHALAGSQGEPQLVGAGDLAPGSLMTLTMTDARAHALTGLFIGFTTAELPFKGGVLVPSPDQVIIGPVTDGAGELTVTTNWWPGVASGVSLWWQFWIADPAALKGAAASNALVSRS
jgi:PKD repeat protein